MPTLANLAAEIQKGGMLPATAKLVKKLAANTTPLPANVTLGTMIRLLSSQGIQEQECPMPVLTILRDTAMYLVMAARR